MILYIDFAATPMAALLKEQEGQYQLLSKWVGESGSKSTNSVQAMDLLISQVGTWRSISKICVGIGPGSFTGLRIALAWVQGLSMGLEGVLLFPFPSLRAWGQGMRNDKLPVIAWARKGWVYLYEKGKEEYLASEDSLESVQEMILGGPWPGVVHSQKILHIEDGFDFVESTRWALTLNSVEATKLSPLYVALPAAQEKLQNSLN